MSTDKTIPVPAGLTPAQETVYRLAVQGYTSEQIGKILHRSLKTIEHHRYAISRKLGVGNTAAMVWEHFTELVLPGLHARVKVLEAAMHKIAYEPIGAAESTDRQILDAIVVLAREAHAPDEQAEGEAA